MEFSPKSLKEICFNINFCSWINIILHSSTLSIFVIGKKNGYFKCMRGVKQGDHLSPLLFCIVEDVLSRNISKLVEQGKIELIKGTRSMQVPSRSLYVDDIMILYKDKISSIHALDNFFNHMLLHLVRILILQNLQYIIVLFLLLELSILLI